MAYDWNQSIGVSGTEDTTFRVCIIEYDANFDKITSFNSSEHYVSATSTRDIVVSQFTSEKYGEAYMFVNFDRQTDVKSKVDVQFKDCGAVALYGGAGFDGTPEIVELDKDGKLTIELEYGEGVFAVPLA